MKAPKRAQRRNMRVWAHGVIRTRIRSLEREIDRLERKPTPAAIHEVRVASRRLRAGLRHLAPCFGGSQAERLRHAARRLAKALGALRDLDILMENLASDAARRGSPVAALVKALKDRREEKLRRLLPEGRLLRHQLPAWREKLGA